MAMSATRAIALADRLIAIPGVSMTLTRSTDTGTPSRPEFTDTDYTVTAYEYETEELHDGVRRHMTKFLISPVSDVVPREDDVITNPGGLKYKLTRVKPTNINGTKVLFEAYAGTK